MNHSCNPSNSSSLSPLCFCCYTNTLGYPCLSSHTANPVTSSMRSLHVLITTTNINISIGHSTPLPSHSLFQRRNHIQQINRHTRLPPSKKPTNILTCLPPTPIHHQHFNPSTQPTPPSHPLQTTKQPHTPNQHTQIRVGPKFTVRVKNLVKRLGKRGLR